MDMSMLSCKSIESPNYSFLQPGHQWQLHDDDDAVCPSLGDGVIRHGSENSIV